MAALFVLVLQHIFRDKLSPQWQYAVWMVVVLRLILPVGWLGRSAIADLTGLGEALRTWVELGLEMCIRDSCCAALGGVVWDFMSHLTPAQLLAAMDSAALETLRAIRDILEDDTLEDPECVQRIDAILSAFYLKLGAEVHRRGI